VLDAGPSVATIFTLRWRRIAILLLKFRFMWAACLMAQSDAPRNAFQPLVASFPALLAGIARRTTVREG
jgi:hypothetical protein